MKHGVLILFLWLITLAGYCQDKEARILYIVDKTPILDDPPKGDNLDKEDIYQLDVITNKDSIKSLGYTEFDKVLLITTKPFNARSTEIKQIPTLKNMTFRDDAWYLKNESTPYTGRFIDYYLNGKEHGEGYIKNGKADGLRTEYYKNGNKKFFRNYVNGIANGESEEYFMNGKLKQKGSFKNGLDDGLWQSFYSTGAIKRQTVFKDTKPQFTKDEEHFLNLLQKGIELMKAEDYQGAIKKLNDAEKLNANYADLYFYRGTARLDNMDFDNALPDFNKAIALEPFYLEAISNRAFVYIDKYEFGDSRKLKQTEGVIVMATKKHTAPPTDKDKICADLNLAVSLGETNQKVLDALDKYCK